MPNPPTHASIAFQIVEVVQAPFVERHLGALVLGATAPDIRAIMDVERDVTHFAPLSSTVIDEGVLTLFATHAHLSPLGDLSEATRAFLLGYVSHLVADQVWINTMYRPFFENPDLFPDRAVGNVMDRALQMEMDRRVRPDVDRALPLLEAADDGVDVGFLEGSLLREWRAWVEQRFTQEFSWDRLRRMARRRQEPDSVSTAEVAAEGFLNHIPTGLARLDERVPWKHVEEYRAVTLTEIERVARKLLA